VLPGKLYRSETSYHRVIIPARHAPFHPLPNLQQPRFQSPVHVNVHENVKVSAPGRFHRVLLLFQLFSLAKQRLLLQMNLRKLKVFRSPTRLLGVSGVRVTPSYPPNIYGKAGVRSCCRLFPHHLLLCPRSYLSCSTRPSRSRVPGPSLLFPSPWD